MTYHHIPGRNVMRPIYELALSRTPQGGKWVEVGVALGRGIAEMARILLDAGRHDVTLYAVDPWGGYARNGEQADMSEKHGGDWGLFLDMMQANAAHELRRIHVVRADSTQAARLFDADSLHLVILDADHTEHAVTEDIGAWLPRVRKGGIIGGDDHDETHFPGVRKACERYFGPAPRGYTVSAENEHRWGVWWRLVDGTESAEVDWVGRYGL